MVLKNKVFHWRKGALLTVTQGVSLHGLEEKAGTEMGLGTETSSLL